MKRPSPRKRNEQPARRPAQDSERPRPSRSSSDRSQKSAGPRSRSNDDADTRRARPAQDGERVRPSRPSSDRPQRSTGPRSRSNDDSDSRRARPAQEGDRPRPSRGASSDRPQRPIGPRSRSADDSDTRRARPAQDGERARPSRSSDRPQRPTGPRNRSADGDTRRPRTTPDGDERGPQRRTTGRDNDRKPYDNPRSPSGRPRRDQSASERPTNRRPARDEGNEHDRPARPRRRYDDEVDEQKPDAAFTLNKYLAHAGLSSRRDAAAIIKEGKVTVNGAVMTTPGYRVQPKDVIKLEGAVMRPQRDHVYVLLNKPKGFITTTEDDRGRKTVMDLVATASEGRLFPVGRLDRNTTGVLLMTTDGDLAQKLSHPRYAARKIYHIGLDKNLTQRDFEKILTGVELEDGIAKVDELAWLETKDEVGLEIHSGRNRIVRRIFESLGYEVEKLDRVLYAGLTKKNVPRGKWRFLTEKELVLLKHFKG